MLQAVETTYLGYRFRSRLEARWCVYFNALDLNFIYEPDGYPIGNDGEWYLPDFWFPELKCFGEVKPIIFTKKEYNKCARLPMPCLLFDTGYPLAAHGYYITDHRLDWEGYKNYISNDNWGRVLLEWSKLKGRIWYLLGEPISSYLLDLSPEIAAKSARFEFGETP